MGYSNQSPPIESFTLSADRLSDKIDVQNCAKGSIAMTWSGALATDAVVKVQESNDGSTWFDISGATVTLAAATGSKKFAIDPDMLFIRINGTKNTESAAVCVFKTFFRGSR